MASSLSDQEWKLIEPLTAKKQTRPPLWSKRQILRWCLPVENGCTVTYPEICLLTQRCFLVLQAVARNWSFRRDYDKLHGKVREQAQNQVDNPDNDWLQAVNTCNASIASKGFCHYKANEWDQKASGCRYTGVSLLHHCTKANVTDDQGLKMLSHNINYFKAKPVNIPKITIWQITAIIPKQSAKLQEIYPQILTKIRFERPKTFKAEKLAQANLDLLQLQPDGLNARTLGWNAASAWSKSLSGLRPCQAKLTLLYQAHA